jgi:hypothetical protein
MSRSRYFPTPIMLCSSGPNLMIKFTGPGLLHCKTLKQAEFMLKTIEERFRGCGLEIHPDKSKIVYCKDINRRADYEQISVVHP